MSQSNLKPTLTCALALAFALALGACSADEAADGGFNQLVDNDGTTMKSDVFNPALDVPLPDDTQTDASGDSLPEDAEPSDSVPDQGSSDGAVGDVGPADVGPADGQQDGSPIEDVAPEDVPPGDTSTSDIPDPDATDTATDTPGPDAPVGCVENADCLLDPVALPPCTTKLCIEGTCVEAPAKVGTPCDLLPEEAGEGCVVGSCDATGGCLAQIVVDIPCEDGDPCTTGETCAEDGKCAGGGPVICAPPGPCQAAVCDAGAGGCVTFPSWDGQPCNDEDPCTEDTVCDGGVCAGSENLCSCETDEDCPNDDDLCNGELACVALPGGGKGCQVVEDTVVVCEEPDSPCVAVACDPVDGACVEKVLSGADCEDGDLCTTNDLCDDAGACVGVPVVCKDEDPCTSDSCAEATGACIFEPSSGSGCSDGDVCTTGDACVEGICVGEPKQCDDANDCTVDACDLTTGACVSEAIAEESCDDDNACTSNDTCDADGGCAGEQIACDDENPCTGIKCDPGVGCLYEPLEIACDDEDACTGPDQCKEGLCDQKPISCDDGIACTIDSCDAASGCAHEIDPGACDDGNPCTEDSCDAAVGCIHEPLSGGACDDENACTAEDSCQGGACVGQPLDCDDGFACTLDGCDEASGCTHQASAEVCVDDNPCTDDDCSVDFGCVNEANKADCEDGNECTTGDVCDEGVCSPGQNSCACEPAPNEELFWSAADGDGEPEFDGLFEETFSSLETGNGQVLTFSNVAASLTGASFNGQAVSYAMTVPAGLSQPELFWHLGGASIEMSAMFLFWEDADGAYHDLFCADDGLNPNGGWSDEEVAQLPYPCANDDTNYNVTGSYAFAPDEKPVSIHLRMLIHAVPTGDTFYIYELGFPDPIFPSPDCDDDNLCNGIFSCLANGGGEGACEQVADPVQCDLDTGDPCQVSSCNAETGACEAAPAPDGTPCPDLNPCTTGEVCLGGACIVSPVGCDDGLACTVDQCDEESGGCTHAPLDALCNDFVPCTVNTCDPTQGCVYTPGLGACDDSNDCTVDQCDPETGCSHTPKDQLCDDAVGCTIDVCDAAIGCLHEPDSAKCADGNACTQDVCLGATGCVHEPNNAACDDGNPCTDNDTCSGGACLSGTVKPCDSGSPCKVGQCDAASGECVFVTLEDGTNCEDDNICTNPDTCVEGLCKAGPVDPCDDGLACTVDSCEAGSGCVHEPQAGACEDDNPCTIDLCDPEVGCEHLPAPEFHPCSDGLDGTGPDVCVEGLCVGFQTTTIPVASDWWCAAVDGVGRSLGVYGGQLFAVVNYTVDGIFCDGQRSQVFALVGATPPDAVANSTIDAVLSSIAYDGVFAESGEVGQFSWGIGSISYFFGDLISEFNNQGEHYAAWAGHITEGDSIEHRTYVVGEHNNGNKGKIRRCIREDDGSVGCKNIENGLKNSEKSAYRPIAVDGLVTADPDDDGDAPDGLFHGVAMVSNDEDGLASLVWGNASDKFDYTLVDNANQVFDVERSGADSIWVSGDQGYLARFDGDETWTQIDGPDAMAGLELTALDRVSGHLLVGGHWEGAAGGEAYLFVLPKGEDAQDPSAWVTVELGLYRQVHAIHGDQNGLTILGRDASSDDDPVAFLWYLGL